MKKYGKLIGGILALIIVIWFATLAYGKLKGRMETGTLVENQTAPLKEKASDESEPKEEAASEDDKTSDRREAIDVKFYDKDGNSRQLSEFYGKPIVMNFWATWCGYCKQEMKDFQETYNEYGEEVEFLFINATDGKRETKEKAVEYLEAENLTIPGYYDEDQEAAYVYSIQTLPTTILIDKEGKVAAYVPGLVEKEPLVRALETLLGE